MMKKLILLLYFFSVSSFNAHAFTCHSINGTIYPGGSTTPVDTWVILSPEQKPGMVQLLSVNQISCKNDVYKWTDILSTDAMATIFNEKLFTDMTGSLTINGSQYYPPIRSGIKVISVTKSETKTIDMNLNLTLKKTPSKNIIIKRGDVIGEFRFLQRNDQNGCPSCGPYRWRLRAQNDIVIATNSCTINNQQPININFGRILREELTTSPKNSLYKKNISLTFNCSGSNISQNIMVTLIGNATSFSSDYIKSTNNNIGFALSWQDKIIRPGGSFQLNMSSNNTQTQIEFSPVKANISSNVINTGNASSSATLIMSAP